MINFMPQFDSQLWQLKCIEKFPDEETMRIHLSDRWNRYKRYVGSDSIYSQHDIIFQHIRERDWLTGWKNYRTVMLDGEVIGYCGE